MSIPFGAIMKNFTETFIFISIGCGLFGVIYTELIVSWQEKTKSFVLAYIVSLVLMVIIYAIYAVVKYYIL